VNPLPSLYSIGKNGRKLFNVSAQVIIFENARAPADGDALAENFVVHERFQGVDKSLQIRGRDQQAFGPAANQFRNTGDVSRHAGNFHGHGFHENHGNALGETRQTENVCCLIQRADVVLIDCSLEHDNVGIP
jgi:hypothetical protein